MTRRRGGRVGGDGDQRDEGHDEGRDEGGDEGHDEGRDGDDAAAVRPARDDASKATRATRDARPGRRSDGDRARATTARHRNAGRVRARSMAPPWRCFGERWGARRRT